MNFAGFSAPFAIVRAIRWIILDRWPDDSQRKQGEVSLAKVAAAAADDDDDDDEDDYYFTKH